MADSLNDQRYASADRVPPLPTSPLAPTIAAQRPPIASETAAGKEPLVFREQSATSDESEMSPVVAVLTSAATMSFFSSATFHLLTMAAIAIIAPYLGLDWLKLIDEPQRPIVAALGDEDIQDDLAAFELVGDLSNQLETPASSIEQLAKELQRSDSASLLAATDDVLRNVMGSDAKDPDAEGSGVLLKVPESGLAVTKGSFTAFTIPANPKPREVYSIVIEIRLPDDVNEFRVSDLVGEVKGSDRYTQKLPYDSRTPYASGYPAENQKIRILDGKTTLKVVNNRVQIIVKVPGAAQLVKDVIRIRSRKLKEEQELTLVFGVPAGQGNEEPADRDKPEEKSDDDSL